MKKGTTKKKVELTEYEKRIERAREVAKKLNRSGKGRIGIGSDIKIFPFRHVLTGIPAFDYITNGGLLEANFTEIWAPKKSSKTTLSATIARNLQMQGELVALASVEPFDKGWWRNIGVFVEYGDEDLEKLETQEERDLALYYNQYYTSLEIIPLTVIQSPNGDEILDKINGLTQSNLYRLIILDSIAEIKSSRVVEERKISDDSEYGGETKLLGRFCHYMRSSMNSFYTKNEETGELEVDQDGDIPNKTCFIGLNQVRANMNSRAMAQENKYHPTGGEALAHEWAQSIFLQRLEVDLTKVKMDDKDKHEVEALAVRTKGVKMKGGPEGREAVYKLHITNHEDSSGISYATGELECFTALKSLCINYDIIMREGRKYSVPSYGGLVFSNTEELDYAVRTDADLYNHLYGTLIDNARSSANTNKVPSVG